VFLAFSSPISIVLAEEEERKFRTTQHMDGQLIGQFITLHPPDPFTSQKKNPIILPAKSTSSTYGTISSPAKLCHKENFPTLSIRLSKFSSDAVGSSEGGCSRGWPAGWLVAPCSNAVPRFNNSKCWSSTGTIPVTDYRLPVSESIHTSTLPVNPAHAPHPP